MEKSEKVSGSVAPWLAELALVQARQLFKSGDETLIGLWEWLVCVGRHKESSKVRVVKSKPFLPT